MKNAVNHENHEKHEIFQADELAMAFTHRVVCMLQPTF
jgi:hypothetical protein